MWWWGGYDRIRVQCVASCGRFWIIWLARREWLEASSGRCLRWAPRWHIIAISTHDTAIRSPTSLRKVVILLEAVAQARVAVPLLHQWLLGFVDTVCWWQLLSNFWALTSTSIVWICSGARGELSRFLAPYAAISRVNSLTFISSASCNCIGIIFPTTVCWIISVLHNLLSRLRWLCRVLSACSQPRLDRLFPRHVLVLKRGWVGHGWQFRSAGLLAADAQVLL